MSGSALGARLATVPGKRLITEAAHSAARNGPMSTVATVCSCSITLSRCLITTYGLTLLTCLGDSPIPSRSSRLARRVA